MAPSPSPNTRSFAHADALAEAFGEFSGDEAFLCLFGIVGDAVEFDLSAFHFVEYHACLWISVAWLSHGAHVYHDLAVCGDDFRFFVVIQLRFIGCHVHAQQRAMAMAAECQLALLVHKVGEECAFINAIRPACRRE